MSQIAYFDLPDVGEGLTEAEIVTWKVKVGDTVSVNQIIVEIETAKSLVELPCPFAGVVTQLLANEGDTVTVGAAIIGVEVSQATAAVAAGTAPISLHSAVAQNAVSTEAIETVSEVSSSSAEEKPQPNLVGYGVSAAAPSRRRRGAAPVGEVASLANAPAPGTDLIAIVPAADVVLAKPPIRKLAKDMNVNIAKVKATGVSGEVTREDVLAAAQVASVFKNQTTPEPKTEREERIPVKGVRKAIATAMVQSAFTAPHVSIFVDVDATRTMEYVKRLKASYTKEGS
jgi:pyruvate dehydrogenase E2 component (dihydrolipoamide acetyltransferase)